MESIPSGNTKHCPLCNDDYSHPFDVSAIMYLGMCTGCREEQIREKRKDESNVKPKKASGKFLKTPKKAYNEVLLPPMSDGPNTNGSGTQAPRPVETAEEKAAREAQQ